MKEHAFLFFALVLPACSGSSSDDVPAPGDSALSDSSNADTHSGTEGGTDSSVTPDTSVETSGDDVATADSGDAGDDPKPPAGSTKCAFGTVTQADAFKACGEPSMTLDYKSDFDGGFTKVPRHCEAATIDSGRYEVWCSPTSTYIWARFEGLRSTSAWSGGCPGEEPLALGMALWDYGIGSSGGGGSLTGVKGIPTFSFTKSSRMAKRIWFSSAHGLISSTVIATLSPGMTILVPSGR